MTDPFTIAESLRRHLPVDEVGSSIAYLFADEILNNCPVNEAQVHENVAKAPFGQCGALNVQSLGQGLWRQGAGR